ncbi:uncharacterized mitochondrial protein AtMg00310-like [Juglans microcarpa x Juglans regia]|uniref:uncharacterized mitochondrial protein AtMg00310-like n=1 Tax=Juglans microcarpa x Juglans regia TaxID=2249226 RepID=UPI001B7EDB49|nr:uncharacterized mitochondrial protein AtMg00310-like [Juglans microcarpa x Juglans regia]
MGVFELPKGLLHELNKLIKGYWWGQINQERKINWISWNQMGKSKIGGGLGFRDFENFNIALLAKQGLRLLQNPNSLAAQVLQLKYFPYSDFFNAKLGSSPSFLWRSLLVVRPLLQEGAIWRIGNGNSVRIWTDKWLPTPSTFKPQSGFQFFDREAKVNLLINHQTREWNINVIKEIFSKEDADTIVQIPLSHYTRSDQLIWRCTKNGMFNVKSAYYLQGDILNSRQ